MFRRVLQDPQSLPQRDAGTSKSTLTFDGMSELQAKIGTLSAIEDLCVARRPFSIKNNSPV